MFECVVGIEFIQSGGVDDRKEEVAQLFRRVLFVFSHQFGLQFVKLLAYLIPYIFFLFPVETNISGFILYSVCLYKTGQRVGNSRQHRFVSFSFLLFPLLPRQFNLRCSRRNVAICRCCSLALGVQFVLVNNLSSLIYRHIVVGNCPPCPIYEVVAEHQFIRLHIANICYIEIVCLAAEQRIEYNVLHNVAKLFTNVLLVLLHQSICKLKCFFYRVGTQTLKGLFPIPRTFLSQSLLYIEQTLKRCKFFFFCMQSYQI